MSGRGHTTLRRITRRAPNTLRCSALAATTTDRDLLVQRRVLERRNARLVGRDAERLGSLRVDRSDRGFLGRDRTSVRIEELDLDRVRLRLRRKVFDAPSQRGFPRFAAEQVERDLDGGLAEQLVVLEDRVAE